MNNRNREIKRYTLVFSISIVPVFCVPVAEYAYSYSYKVNHKYSHVRLLKIIDKIKEAIDNSKIIIAITYIRLVIGQDVTLNK